MACADPIPVYGLASVAPPKWDGGARSAASFDVDGWVRFTTHGDSVGAVVGLNGVDTGPSSLDIKHGILFKYLTYQVVESGALKTPPATFLHDDDFYIQRVGNTVYYMIRGDDASDSDFFTDPRLPGVRLPGVIVYESTTPSNGTVFLDASLYAKNDRVRREQINPGEWSNFYIGEGPDGDGSGNPAATDGSGYGTIPVQAWGVGSEGVTEYDAAAWLAMPLALGPLPDLPFATFDPAILSNGTLSNDNFTVTKSGGTVVSAEVLATLGEADKTDEQRRETYIEFTADTVSGDVFVGFKFASGTGAPTDQISVRNNGDYSFLGTTGNNAGMAFVDGDIIGIVLQYSPGVDEVDVSVWVNGVAATGTDPEDIFDGDGPSAPYSGIDTSGVTFFDLRPFVRFNTVGAAAVTVNTGNQPWDESSAASYEINGDYDGNVMPGRLGFPLVAPEYHGSAESGIRGGMPLTGIGFSDEFGPTGAAIGDLSLPFAGSGEVSFPITFTSMVGVFPIAVDGYASAAETSAKAGHSYSETYLPLSAGGWGTAAIGEDPPEAIGYGEMPIMGSGFGSQLSVDYFSVNLLFNPNTLDGPVSEDVQEQILVEDAVQLDYANNQLEQISIGTATQTFYNPTSEVLEDIQVATEQQGDIITAIAEIVQAFDVVTYQQVACIAEYLLAEGVVDTLYKGMVDVIAAMTITDSNRAADATKVADNMTVGTVLTENRKLFTQLVSAMTVTDTVTNLLTITVLIGDELQVGDTTELSQSLLVELLEHVDVHTMFRVSDAAAEGWVMNTEGQQPISEYDNFNFNSLTFYKDQMYSAGDEGIYTHAADDDEGADITAELASMMLDFGTSRMKRIRSAYLGYTASNELVMKVRSVSDGQVSEYWYKATQNAVSDAPEGSYMPVGQGLKSRYWQFELTNMDGGDFEIDQVELHPLILNRRV